MSQDVVCDDLKFSNISDNTKVLETSTDFTNSYNFGEIVLKVGTEPQSTLPDNPARGSSPAQPPLTSPTASPQLAGGPPLPGQIENTAGHLSSSQEDGVTSGDPNLPAGPASGGLHSSPGSVLLPAECSRL